MLALVLSAACSAQITTSINSLPEVGDLLNYKTLENITADYELSGENITWDFTQMTGDVIQEEAYSNAENGIYFSQFPDTDLLVNFTGIEAYANRNTTNIEIVGVTAGQLFEGSELNTAQPLSEPFVIRRAPIGYEDTFSGSSTFGFSSATADFGELADLINEFNPIEGASIDSIRINIEISRTEEVDGHGTVLIGSESIPALRLVQTDITEVSLEIFVVTGILDTWFNISDLIDLGELGFEGLEVTNYQFLAEDSKEYILEVNVDSTTGTATGRYNSDFTNGVNDNHSAVLNVYPNPFQRNISFTNTDFDQLIILDALGKEMINVDLDSLQNIELELSHLKSGMYYLVMKNLRSNFQTQTKLVKR